MRLLVTTLVCTAFICSAFPQHISMEYSGAGLANRDKKHIELFLRHAAKFYHQHGMPDTLRIKLNLFDNKEKWDEFIFSKEKRRNNSTLQIRGLFDSKTNVCHVTLAGTTKSESLSTIRHELSHALFCKTFDNAMLPWLNEGLSEYFQHCSVSDKALKHSFDAYERGRLRTMIMLDETRLEDIFNYKYKEFQRHQRTNDQISYIASHAIVAFLIEVAPQGCLNRLVRVLKDKNDKDNTLQKIDKTYPGGWEQLKKDFTDYYR